MQHLKFKILTFFISVILLLGSFELLLRLSGYGPWKDHIVVNKPVMHEPDSKLGWKNKPGKYVYSAYVPNEKDIKVTFLADNSRITEEETISNQVDNRDKMVIVGCSFTQGWAISDDETYAWKLQHQYPKLKVLNYGTGGYGTYQSLLVLERFFTNNSKPVKLVLYGMIGEHEIRNVASEGWLRAIARSSKRSRHISVPYSTIDNDGNLSRHFIEIPESYPMWPLREWLATSSFLQRIYIRLKTMKRAFQARLVTEKLLLEMKNFVEKQGTKLVVTLLAFKDNNTKLHYVEFFEKQNIKYIDCVYPLTPDMRVRGEGHPNGKMNTRWASCIANSIGKYLN